MVSSVLSLILAAAIGQQAPAEAAWLKAIPADAEAVVYLKGVSSTRDDLLAMIRAMSPTLAQMAEPAISQGVEQLIQQATAEVAKTPFLVALKLPSPDAQGPPALAILARIEDVDALLKSAGGSGETEKVPGGFEKAKGREEMYLYRGEGFVAIAPTDEMIRTIAAKPGTSLDAKLSRELKDELFGGDLGGYISLVAVQNQYGEQIEQAREALMAAMDQAGGQIQGAQIEQAKKMYGAMFDAIKQGDALAMNMDFDAAQFALSGFVTVKPDTDAAKALANARTGNAAVLGTLPEGYFAYVYMNVDPENLQNLQQFSMAGAFAGQLGEAEMKKAMDAMKAAGRQEAAGAVSFGGGFNMVNVAVPEHPKVFLDSTKTMMNAMKGSDLIKDVKVEENAETYKDISFTKISATFDLDKLAGAQPNNPQATSMIKQMFGGDGTMTTWYGSDGKRVFTATGKDFAQVKPKLDAVLGGSTGGIGQSAGFKAIRGKLPEQVGVIFLINAQEMVKQLTSLMSSVTGAEMPAPADMPKDSTYFGGSIASTPAGTRFDFVVPSTVGPVFEKGFGPMIQAIQGQVNQ